MLKMKVSKHETEFLKSGLKSWDEEGGTSKVFKNGQKTIDNESWITIEFTDLPSGSPIVHQHALKDITLIIYITLLNTLLSKLFKI